jgi:hypothetical protein
MFKIKGGEKNMMNLNTVAKEITLAEGKKINLSIAQVKEVLGLFVDYLANYPFADVAAMLAKHQPKKKKAKK